MITRYFNLQLNAGGALPPVINVNQYDSGETWVFTLYQDDGTVYQPSSGSIVGVKADGNAIANAGSIDSDGRVVITETQQMTAVAGVVNCELTLDAGVHGTLNFTLQVEADPVDGAVVSASDLSLISQGIQAAEDARTALGSIAPTNVGTSGQFLMRNATTSEWSDLPDRSSDDVVFADTETLTQKVTAMQSDITTNANNITTNANSITQILANIGTSESSPSTADYAVGDYLLYNKVLYKVTAAITIGDALTIGTNIETANICDHMSMIKSASFSGNVNSHGNLSLTGDLESVPIIATVCDNKSTYVCVGKNSSSTPKNMLVFRGTDDDAQLTSGTAVSGTVYYLNI